MKSNISSLFLKHKWASICLTKSMAVKFNTNFTSLNVFPSVYDLT